MKISLLKLLWVNFSSRRKKQFWLLLILMVVTSLFEMVSIGAVIPFLAVITDPEYIYQHKIMQPIIQQLQLTKPSQLVLPFAVIFIISSIAAGGVRLLLLYAVTKFSFATGADISFSIYRRTLYQKYETHASRNTSKVIDSIITKTYTVANGVVNSVLFFISSIMFSVVILGTLFAIDVIVAAIAFISLGGSYFLISIYVHKYLKNNSKCIAESSSQVVKSLQEGLSGIRDVLLDNSQEYFCQNYRKSDIVMRKAHGMNIFIGSSPRFIMEAIGMSLIAIAAYNMSISENGLSTTMPILGALALGAQKLLPTLQQAYNSYSNIRGSESSLYDVLDLLKQPLPKNINPKEIDSISFKHEIILENLSFGYKGCPLIIDNFNLTIKKGDRIGFIGPTGCGKSTLVDVIMGLLTPTSGKIIVDKRQISLKNVKEWQLHVSHVPQSIYLSDNSIEENIAFGIPIEKINHQKVIEVAQKAKVSKLIEGWEEGYKTFVGERGAKLSGGQCQRIGIARALYKNSDLLVLDEATSALDDKTEQYIMESIEELDKDITVLIIAHRLSTLKKCNRIIKIEDGNKFTIGTYKEMIDK